MNFIKIIFLFNFTNSNEKKTIRKEIRDLSPEEWQTYKRAFLNLKKHGILDDISEMHTQLNKYAHNTPLFFPWHRALLIHFETLLKEINHNQDLSVPYWDWTLDYLDPLKSKIFSEDYWNLDPSKCFELEYPNNHCLKRAEDIDPFYNKEQINRLLNKKSKYDEFREYMELVPHAVVHFNVGGKEGDMSFMHSPNDPIFWHHHSYCDYLWFKKQKLDLKNNFVEDKSKKIGLDSVLKPFGMKVKDMMDLNKLNIVYKEFKPTKIMMLSNEKSVVKEPARISEEYAKRHGYNLQKVREIEEFLINGKNKQKKGFLFRILQFLFCINDN
ncbi:hypothetical protein EDEG_01124 [Edhazardia aedis USNM 41457]|uniref:Tyrosinase copper-binding domain-containing protein n=1 Tax=Edhazardia aedis (strain USNM 41457) TaxID=1003232 RepID=J9DAB6_EDHAE|nr:hypothetical protein EDEG_01124 [Edhazardia aedis USNM 41457]|eukprot:EJW04676.1 hypothetical protein EDEG_01124 [Edhazardia aedis USNM 41457]